MRGLLADVNVHGHLPYLGFILRRLELWPVLIQQKIEFATFNELQLPNDVKDRTLWNACQERGWVLLTDNRNDDGPDSLGATLADSWRVGQLPVLTLSSKARFERDTIYAERVASDIAELLFGIAHEEYCAQPRIYVPLM